MWLVKYVATKQKTLGSMKLHVKNKHEVGQIDGNTTMTDTETKDATVQKDFRLKKVDLEQLDEKER